MGVSTAKTVTLTSGGQAEINAGPCVVTSVVVTELTGAAPAVVALLGCTDATLLMSLAVAAGQSCVWSGEPIAAGGGVAAACQTGDVQVTVAHR